MFSTHYNNAILRKGMIHMEFSKRMDRFGESIFTVMKNRRTAVEARGQEVIDFSIGAPNIPPAPRIYPRCSVRKR